MAGVARLAAMNGYESAVTGIGPVTFGSGVAFTAKSKVAIAASMVSSNIGRLFSVRPTGQATIGTASLTASGRSPTLGGLVGEGYTIRADLEIQKFWDLQSALDVARFEDF